MMQSLFNGTFWDAFTRMTVTQMIFATLIIAFVCVTIVAFRLTSNEKTKQYFEFQKFKIEHDTNLNKKKENNHADTHQCDQS